MSFALFLLRALLGGLMIGHGSQKLLGKFGGHGPDGTGQFFDSIGIKPGKPMAMAAGGTEAGGGALLVLGLATPAAAAGISSVMMTAAWTVHRPNGPWIDSGGYEYNAVVVATLLALVSAGPGSISLDAARGRSQWGLGWGLASIAAGAAGAAGVIAAGQSGQTPSPAGTDAHEVPSGGAS